MLSSNTSAVSGDANYIEDVFSTYLIKPAADFTNYSINNGIDLSTKGGMTWFKARDAAQNNLVYDTVRGSSSGSPNALITNGTQAQQTSFFDYVTPNTNGFTVNYLSGGGQLTNSGINYASWTFRKQPKFFDVVTYTGDGTDNRAISHSLGSTPGCYIVKRTEDTSSWAVYHRRLNGGTNPQNYFVTLNTANAQSLNTGYFGTAPTSTSFYVSGNVNANGSTYVVYLFAHDAGGFGLTGTDNVISCGSFTSTGSVLSVNLGYEPQWLLYKESASTGDWKLIDNMRGFQVDRSGATVQLNPNLSSAESALGLVGPTATGFTFDNGGSGVAYIYIAIRRGPMKVPTDATKVFTPNAWAGTGVPTIVPAGFPIDMVWIRNRSASGGIGGNGYDFDRLRGANCALVLNSTGAEDTSWGAGYDYLDNSTGFGVAAGAFFNNSGTNYIDWMFRRAPSFFDEVCYTGTGTNVQAQPHNLGVVPELMIIKKRSAVDSWFVGANLGASTYTRYLLNSTAAGVTTTYGSGSVDLGAQPTTTNFYLGTEARTNGSGSTYVAYLFATCAGVSKVGNYTGTGTTKQVDCGFAAGARFVLIKRTDSPGDWYVWDTARGIVSGNDPYLLLNSTAAEVTSTDYIDAYSAGFELSSTAPAALNASGGTYIFLAIA